MTRAERAARRRQVRAERARRLAELRAERAAAIEAARAARPPGCSLVAREAAGLARAQVERLRAEEKARRAAVAERLAEARIARRKAAPAARAACRAEVERLRAAEREARQRARELSAATRAEARRELAALRADAARSARPRTAAQVRYQEKVEREIGDFLADYPHLEGWARRQARLGRAGKSRRSIAEALREAYEADPEGVEASEAARIEAAAERAAAAHEAAERAAYEAGERPEGGPAPTAEELAAWRAQRAEGEDFGAWLEANPRALTPARRGGYAARMATKTATKKNPPNPNPRPRRPAGVRTIVVNEPTANPRRRRRRRRNPGVLGAILWGGAGGVAAMAVERLERLIPAGQLVGGLINLGSGAVGAWGLSMVAPEMAPGFMGGMVEAGGQKVWGALMPATTTKPATAGLPQGNASTGRIIMLQPGQALGLPPGATGAVRVLVDRAAVGALRMGDAVQDRQPAPARPAPSPAATAAAGMRLLGRRA